MQHFHSLSWKIINSYSLVSLGSCGTSKSCGLDVRNGLHEPILRSLRCVVRDLLSRNLTNRNYILYVVYHDWSFQGACFSIYLQQHVCNSLVHMLLLVSNSLRNDKFYHPSYQVVTFNLHSSLITSLLEFTSVHRIWP